LFGGRLLDISGTPSARTLISPASYHHNTFTSTVLTMDLASLKEAAANLTLYDLKAGVRKVQNGRPSPVPPAVILLTEDIQPS
jgi:hypothetical protein